MSWSTSLYGCPTDYKVWTNYVQSDDWVIMEWPKGGGKIWGYVWGTNPGSTLEACKNACNNDPLCMGFSRRSVPNYSSNPDDPLSPSASCQIYRGWKSDSATFATTFYTSSYSGPSRYFQKITKNCIYTDPGVSACTINCTRPLTITQAATPDASVQCPNPTTLSCSNNEGNCCNPNVLYGTASVFTDPPGTSMGNSSQWVSVDVSQRGSYSKIGSACTLTCASPYNGTYCSGLCPRVGGWGNIYPADGSVTGLKAYVVSNGITYQLTPNTKAGALNYTKDGFGGKAIISSGTQNGSCVEPSAGNGCDPLFNGLGYWYTIGLAWCGFIACNTDIPVAQGSRNPTAACQATCNQLGNGRGVWTGSTCGTVSCYTVTVRNTATGITSIAGIYSGSDCSGLTCSSGFTKTIAGDRCCPTPAGVTNPQIYTNSDGACIVNNCPRLANNKGQTTPTPDGGCTGTPVCDRLPSGKGGWSGTDCNTLMCDTDIAPYGVRSGSDCLTITCNTITNGTYAPAGVCTGTPICNRLPNNLGIYSLYIFGNTQTCDPLYKPPICDSTTNGTRIPGPNNDCTQVVCDTVANGTRTGANCTVSCNAGFSLSPSGSKCCATVAGATSYDETTCNATKDCVLKSAGPDDYWSACTATTCGATGTQTRTRVIDMQAAYGGRACAATLNRSTETNSVLLANGAITETRNCTKTCTDMKELPKDVAEARCTSDTNCKIIGFEEQNGFSLYSSVANTVSSPFDLDAVYVKSGQTTPSVSGVTNPTGYTTQTSKRYSNIAPISDYANPLALTPDDCVRVEDQCTLDTKCVGFDLNSQTNLCTRILTNTPADLSNTQLWTTTTDATRTTYIKSQV